MRATHGMTAAVLVLLAATGRGSAAGGDAAAMPVAEGGGNPPRVAAAATSEEAPTDRVQRLLDEWRFDEARKVLQELEAQARWTPAPPDLLFVQGYARFLDGDYRGAVAKLDAAAHADAGDRVVRDLLGLARAAEQAVAGHREIRSRHFVVLLPPEDELLGTYALDALEAQASALKNDLGFELARPVRVEIYRGAADLAAASSLSEAEIARTGTIALCKWARLMVTTPRALALGYPWLDTMSHELVHYALSQLTRDRSPVWLQEGVAKFLEQRWQAPAGGRLPPSLEHLLARGLQSGKLISFDAMHPSLAKLPSAEDASLAFAEVATAIEYLFSIGGTAALKAVVADVRDGKDARAAVAAAAGKTWPEFERGWRTYMNAQHYRTYPAIELPTTKLRKPGAMASKRRPSEDEALASSSKLAEPMRLLRVGNMLLMRNRPRAAAQEYEKGAKLSGGHWLFAVKLGRVYLNLHDPDRALQAVAGSTAVFPELPWAHVIAGQAYLTKGDPAKAAAALSAALASNPFDPAVHCGLAEAYARLPLDKTPGQKRLELERKLCRELAE